MRDAKRSQAKTSCGDTGNFTRVLPVRPAAVFHQAGLRVRGFPEKQKRSAFEFVEKLIIRWRKRCRAGIKRRYDQESWQGAVSPLRREAKT